MRKQAPTPLLDSANVDTNPFIQFDKWYGEAYKISGEEASAMTIATVSKKQPNARTVYLRGSDTKGFWFFTNYNSRKAKEISENKQACLLFFWHRLFRQVKMWGYIEKLPSKISDDYFNNRDRESQIGAWASAQSKVLADRTELNDLMDAYTKKFEGKPVPRPKHWGGYKLVPSYFEFWYGRESRLHDRIVYSKQKGRSWKIERLSP